MKLHEAMQGGPVVYINEWDNQNGFSDWASESYEGEEYRDVVQGTIDDWDVQGSEIAPGRWVGITFGDAEFTEEEDEDGKYMHEEMGGVIAVVSAQPLPENHAVFQKAMAEFKQGAEDHMEEERAAYQDAKDYQRDPYSYYGLNRKDFY